MSTANISRSELLSSALALPLEERRELVREISVTFPPPGPYMDDPGFAEELQRRWEAYKSGEDPGIDAEVVMQLMRAKIDRRQNR